MPMPAADLDRAEDMNPDPAADAVAVADAAADADAAPAADAAAARCWDADAMHHSDGDESYTGPMLDRLAARELAQRTVPDGVTIDDSRVRELMHGWYFPYRDLGEVCAGSNGAVVNKATGKVFRLGSAFPPERDLDLYDRGYQFESTVHVSFVRVFRLCDR